MASSDKRLAHAVNERRGPGCDWERMPMKTYAKTLVFGLLTALVPACAVQGDASDDDSSWEAEANAIVPSTPFYGDPKNGAVYALDVSFWEGPLSQREMDCFWDSGVRHIVVGTQVEELTRQQLSMAVARGMTVDAYVYLYWDKDVATQTREAFRRVSGFPIGRMWLDVEENPAGLGSSKLVSFVRAGLDECTALGGSAIGCGIYTGPGFWKSYMSNTSELASVPLWYAQYNGRTGLDAWSSEKFGGWSQPVAKQWAEQALCGVGVDKDTMQVTTKPSVVVDRATPPDTGLPPAAPDGLYPAEGSVVGVDYVKLMSATVPRATGYQLALERWDAASASFRPYYTWSTSDPFVKTYPPRSALYRMRVRARNARGFGAWSAYSMFDYGKYTGTRPSDSPTEPAPPPTTEPSTPPPTEPPPATGVPSALAPHDTTVSTAAVTLTYAGVAGATRYELAIENATSSGAFVPYVTYSTTALSKTYYPAIHRTKYRFRVRAEVASVMSAWSSWATFDYQ